MTCHSPGLCELLKRSNYRRSYFSSVLRLSGQFQSFARHRKPRTCDAYDRRLADSSCYSPKKNARERNRGLAQAVRQRCCTRTGIGLRSRYLTEESGISPCRRNLSKIRCIGSRPSTAGSRSTSARIPSVRTMAPRLPRLLGAARSATAMSSSVLDGSTPCSSATPAASIRLSRATRASLRSARVWAPT